MGTPTRIVLGHHRVQPGKARVESQELIPLSVGVLLGTTPFGKGSLTSYPSGFFVLFQCLSFPKPVHIHVLAVITV